MYIKKPKLGWQNEDSVLLKTFTLHIPNAFMNVLKLEKKDGKPQNP